MRDRDWQYMITCWPGSPFTKIDFNPASDNDCAHYEMYDEITYRFPNFNGVGAEVFEWMSNYIPHVAWRMITQTAKLMGPKWCPP